MLCATTKLCIRHRCSTGSTRALIAFFSGRGVDNRRDEQGHALHSVLDIYRSLVEGESFVHDEGQLRAAAVLTPWVEQTLSHFRQSGVAHRDPKSLASASGAGTRSRDGSEHPTGIFLHGQVGSGKTMLMDMAISGLLESGMHSVPLSAIGATPSTSHTPPDGRRGLCRAHFHEFMLMTHRMVHTLETLRPKVLVKSRTGQPVHRFGPLPKHPLDLTAEEISRHVGVLCLDELHVRDVADGMMLARLLRVMNGEYGVRMLFTANREPEALYRGGVSRHFFEPLIDMIRETMAVVHVGGAGFDYRMLAAVKSGASERDAEQEAHLEGERTDVRSVCDEEAAYPGAGSSERAAGRGEGRGRVGSEERRGTSSISGPWGHISGKMGNGPIEGSLRSSLMTRAGIPATGALFKGVNAWQRVDDALGRLVRAAEEFGGGRGPRSVPVGFGRDLRLPECVFVAGRQGAGLVRERRGEGEEGGSSGRGFLAAVVGFEELLGRRGVDGSGPLGPSDMVALATHVDTLAVRGVRQITPLEADMATRLATLIDALYDAGGSLLLEVPGDGLETFTHVFVPLLAEAADLGVDIRLGSAFHASELVFRGTTAGHIAGDGSMASGVGHWEDQVLMWRRCASRVGEMCVEL